MALSIFICYRRDDTAPSAGRLHDFLRSELGRGTKIVRDVDSIPLGENFEKVLEGAVANCDVFLAVIGTKWLDIVDEFGNRRIDNDHDFVRIEIAAALRREIPLIPITIDGAKLPKERDLPSQIKDLALRQKLEVRNDSFKTDVERLARELRSRMQPFYKTWLPQNEKVEAAAVGKSNRAEKPAAEPGEKPAKRGLAAALAVIAIIFALVIFAKFVPTSQSNVNTSRSNVSANYDWRSDPYCEKLGNDAAIHRCKEANVPCYAMRDPNGLKACLEVNYGIRD